MYDFARISFPTRRIFLKIHNIWETCYKHCKCLGSRDVAPDALEFPPTHYCNRNLDDCDCYMVRVASVETLCTYMNTIVCGDACLNAYNEVSE